MSPVDLAPIAERHGIRMLLQFGSTVTGHVHERSDVVAEALATTAPRG